MGEVLQAGGIREARMQQLRAVLGSVGLGALLPTLVRAKVKSLASLALLGLDELQTAITDAGGARLAPAQREKLSSLGMCAAAAPPAPAQMERV